MGRRMVFSGAPGLPGLGQMPGPPRPVPRNHTACCGLPGLTAPNLSRSPVQSSEGRTFFFDLILGDRLARQAARHRHPYVVSDLPRNLLTAVPVAPKTIGNTGDL